MEIKPRNQISSLQKEKDQRLSVRLRLMEQRQILRSSRSCNQTLASLIRFISYRHPAKITWNNPPGKKGKDPGRTHRRFMFRKVITDVPSAAPAPC